MGWLVDRVGVYWTIAVGQFVVGLFVLSISFVHSFLIICGLLFLAGMGHGPINPATGKAVMLWFSKEGRATAMGIKQTGIPIGGALAAATIPTIALILAWRKAIIISGAISLISVLVCLLFYKDPTKGDVDKIHQPLPLSVIWKIFKNRDLMILSSLTIVFLSLQASLETYLILFCKNSLQYSIVTAGYFLSLAYIGGIVGRLAWGSISDFWLGGRRKVILMMIGGLSSVLCLTFAFLSHGSPIWSIAVAVFLFGSSAFGWNAIHLTWVAELAGSSLAGMATGVSLSIGLVGVLLGPPLFGYIIDKTSSYLNAWLFFFVMMVITSILLGFVQEGKKA
jgi:sugar phosphate permease